jgi:hypothetical protein
MLTQIVGRVAKLCSRVESMVEEVNVGRQLVSSDLRSRGWQCLSASELAAILRV